MHRPRARPPWGAVAGAAAIVTGTACRSNFGAPAPAAVQGQEVVDLWRVFVVVAACVGALVWGLILWSVVRYRRRGDALPRQTFANVPVEVVYTGVPILLVAVLFGLTMGTQGKVQRLDPSPGVVVEATAFQWQWRFDYPREGVSLVGETERPPTLVLPLGATVRFRLASADVVHAFFVPEFLVKRDAIPGRTVEFDVTPTRTGTFAGGRCAEFCGLNHDRMTFTVSVVELAEFERWVAGAKRRAA